MTRKKKSPIKGKKLRAGQLRKEVFRLFKHNPKKRFSAKQIIKKLKIFNTKDSVHHALTTLQQEGKLLPIDEYKFRLNKESLSEDSTSHSHSNSSRTSSRTKEVRGKTVEGYVDMTRTGAAYIIVDNMEQDVYVPARRMNFAFHGDKVRIALKHWRNGRRPEGEVVAVLQRSTEYFIGTLHLSRKYGIFIPDRQNMPVDVFVHLKDIQNAEDRDKVVVKVTDWPTRHNHSPRGIVTSVLGSVGGNELEMKSILLNNGFDLDFPEEVIAEAEAFSTDIAQEEILRRRDMRAITTFTIDPVDAKDFDDALSIEFLENDEVEIGVHIADVTHYVKSKTALDKSAFRRSTSVYLVDRVLPMLPERLSNGLCSLRPKEDKLTFSAVFQFDKKGKVKSRWFGRTVIHSDRRYAYGEAQRVLESEEGDYATELAKLNELAKKLRKEKFKKGAISFEAEEVKFKLDEEGTPIEVYVKERKDAHLLIEDFMLLANREVAAYISKKSKSKEVPFVYRVHDQPDQEKLMEFATYAAQLGFTMELDTPAKIADSFNRLAAAAREDESLKLLEPIAIRTMAKAIYTTENIGHYGLGFEHYTHFTSPIRRYADVLAHRVLEANLEETTYFDKGVLEEQCRHISNQERKAQDAERESIKYKQVEFIEGRIGEVFEGAISGFHDQGIYVEIKENRCEGMARFSSMDEPFEVSYGRLSAKGLRSGTVLRMGQTVWVKIINADLARRKIDMVWVDAPEEEEEEL
ncbi:MAG: ribonuclease R [Bacteroidota bacterium]